MGNKRTTFERRFDEFLGVVGLRAFQAIVRAAPDPRHWEWEDFRSALALAKILSTPAEQRTPLENELLVSTPKVLELGPIDFSMGNYKQQSAQRERRGARQEIEAMFAQKDPRRLLARPVDEYGWARLVDRWIELERHKTK
jgi:hypothetical protein